MNAAAANELRGFMRKLVLKLMLGVVVLWGVGCAATKTAPQLVPPAPPKPPENPWSWLPESSTVIGRVAIDELRKTALWPLWSEIEGEQKLASWVDLPKVSRVTFGGTGQSREDMSYVAVLEGAFGETELSLLAQRDQVSAEQRGLLTVYHKPEGYWTQLTPRLIVMCTPDRIDALVLRASQGDGTLIKEGALYKSLAERVQLEGAHVVVLADELAGEGRERLEQRASRYGLGSLTREAARVGVSIEVGSEYRLVALAETADEQKANALSGDVKQKLDEVASNFFVRMLGIGALLSKVRVSNDSRYVFVRGNVPEVDFNEVIKRVHSALSLANGAGSLGELP